jgi:sulfur carrier protein
VYVVIVHNLFLMEKSESVTQLMSHFLPMNIQLNGQCRCIPETSSIAGLLAEEGFSERRVAVEVNGEIVPRTLHVNYVLREGDRVEIVHALGGG